MCITKYIHPGSLCKSIVNSVLVAGIEVKWESANAFLQRFLSTDVRKSNLFLAG